MAILSAWWAWGMAAVAFAIAEMLLPSYLFLGFAIGSSVLAAIMLIGGPVAEWLLASPEGLLLAFALMSLAGWIVLRRVLGVRDGQVKVIEKDIND